MLAYLETFTGSLPSMLPNYGTPINSRDNTISNRDIICLFSPLSCCLLKCRSTTKCTWTYDAWWTIAKSQRGASVVTRWVFTGINTFCLCELHRLSPLLYLQEPPKNSNHVSFPEFQQTGSSKQFSNGTTNTLDEVDCNLVLLAFSNHFK